MSTHTDRVKARQHALRDQGLCISCGNEASISVHTGKPYSLCDGCREKNSDKSKKSKTEGKSASKPPRGIPAAVTTTGQHYHVVETGEIGKVCPCPCDDPLILKFEDGVLDAFHLCELEETDRQLTVSINRGVPNGNGRKGRPKGMETGTVNKMLQIYRFLLHQTEPVYRAQIEKAVGFNITRPLMVQKSLAQCVTMESLGIVKRLPGHRTWAAWELTEHGRSEGERVIKSLYTKGNQEAGKRFRAKAVANGRCSRCGRHPAHPGLKTCGLCNQIGATTVEQQRSKSRESTQQKPGTRAMASRHVAAG